MSTATESATQRIEEYLELHQRKSLLRFITCGSVDDGKSTLIGRLLYETKALFDDQLSVLETDSKRVGTRGGEIDFALLLDGLSAEREQGITIDVSYRYFSTDQRTFIVADTPGHEQYTRNMATGASTADLAILLIDARKGVLLQTRRHSYIASLLGIKNVILAVNKMDLVGYSRETFEQIENDFREFAKHLEFREIVCIPICAVHGENVVNRADSMPWYQGQTLMQTLETVPVDESLRNLEPMRLPVQWVNRPNLDFRGFAGTVAGGVVRRGQRVRIQPSGRESHISRIVTADGDIEAAYTNQSITVTLTDEVDVSRGDLISDADSPALVANQFEAMIVWMSAQPMLRGRNYLMKIGPKTVTATVAPLKYSININTLERAPANKLDLNEIGVVDLELDRPVAFDAYRNNRETGGFILIDRLTNETVGAGMLHFALRRSDNIHWQALEVDKAARCAQAGHKSGVIWLTGLSGAGKSTIANMLEKRLHSLGIRTYLLDGDNVRHGLNKDLGFKPEDRVENIRRVAEVAKLMVDAGLVVITAFISPFRTERKMAREIVEQDEFVEVYVDAPLEVAEARDPKGLYKKARRGELFNFTGIDSPYEPPEAADVHVLSSVHSVDESVEQIIGYLYRHGLLKADGK